MHVSWTELLRRQLKLRVVLDSTVTANLYDGPKLSYASPNITPLPSGTLLRMKNVNRGIEDMQMSLLFSMQPKRLTKR